MIFYCIKINEENDTRDASVFKSQGRDGDNYYEVSKSIDMPDGITCCPITGTILLEGFWLSEIERGCRVCYYSESDFKIADSESTVAFLAEQTLMIIKNSQEILSKLVS